MDKRSFLRPFLGLSTSQQPPATGSSPPCSSSSWSSEPSETSSQASLSVNDELTRTRTGTTTTSLTATDAVNAVSMATTAPLAIPGANHHLHLNHESQNHESPSRNTLSHVHDPTSNNSVTSTSSINSAVLGSSSTNIATVTSLCAGTPRNLVSSHSGNITVALALQEPAVFLACSPRSSASYSESDGYNVDEPATQNQERGFFDGIRRYYSNDVAGAGAGAAQVQALSVEPSDLARVTTSSSEYSGNGSTNASASASGRDNADLPDTDTNSNPALSDTPATGSSSIGLSPSMLRGSVVLKVTKPTKIKGLSLGFYGISRTVWSEVRTDSMVDDSNLHAPTDFFDNYYINVHRWEFMPSTVLNKVNRKSLESLDHSCTLVGTDLYGADNAVLKSEPSKVTTKTSTESKVINYNGKNIINDDIMVFKPNGCSRRKLSSSSVATKDAFTLPPGEYVYNFNLAIDPAVPESITVPNGSIEYFLQAKVVRAGTFAPNICGQQPVPLIRSPPDNSEGQQFNNPLVISKNWEGRLQYEIALPQKYVPLGINVPFSIKLMPTDKIMVHRIRVFITEQIEHRSTLDQSLKQTDRSIKLLLFEKKGQTRRVVINSKGDTREKLVGNLLSSNNSETAGLDEDDIYSPSLKTIINGELPLLSSGTDFASIPRQYLDSANNVRYLRPDHSSSPYLRVRHRLIFALRMSIQEPEDVKRRHYEVKIDTPVTLLAKMCSQGNVTLPLYSESVPAGSMPWNVLDDSEDVNYDEVPLDYTMSNTSELINSPPTFDDALAERRGSRSHALFTEPPPPDYSSSVGA